MVSGTYNLKGITPVFPVTYRTKKIPYATGIPPRLEISKLWLSEDPHIQKQWTLFILSLAKFKAEPVNKKLSFFQIAGIHSSPETPWDGADAPPGDPDNPGPGDNPFGGYCQHNTLLFPTWHRPYMLLFEKRIWELMADVLEDLDPDIHERRLWEIAAEEWRLPYWDWARRRSYDGQFSLPQVFTKEYVSIRLPKGGISEVKNSLWGFDNPEKDGRGRPLPFGKMPPGKEQWNIKNSDDGTIPWGECTGIGRYGLQSRDNGKTVTGLQGVNNFQTANANLDNFSQHWYSPFPKGSKERAEWKPPSTLADAVNRMFSPKYNETWGTFATTKWWNESERTLTTGYMSLEFVHNNLHNVAGGTDYNEGGVGHMGDVGVSAFDPIFWLHHCNVDRLFAIWQALKWDAWWDTPEPDHGGTNVPNATPKDPLKPFHNVENGNPKKDFWTSEGARDWTKLLYTYDDLEPSRDAILSDGTLNEEKYVENLQAFIQNTYPSTQDYVHQVSKDSGVDAPSFFGPIHQDQGKPWYDYIINVVYDRYALNGRSYTIKFWLGGEPGDIDSIVGDAQNLVGQIYVFAGASADAGGCENCHNQRDNKVLSRAQVPISIPVISQALDEKYRHLGSTQRDEVEAYLESHLHWTFVQFGGEGRPAADFPDTKISVWQGEGRPQGLTSDGQKLPPQYGNFAPLYRPTHGKEGGLRRDDAKLGEGNFRGA